MSNGNKKKSQQQVRRQLSYKLVLSDERVPKLVGLLCWLFAFYLLIAFISYIFTWRLDQSVVMRFELGLLFVGGEDAAVANWLGRLGAITSHQFFYWLFGLPSFYFVYMLVITGTGLVKGVQLRRYNRHYRNALFTMLWSSALLAFLFTYTGISEFPWGGSIGEAIVGWMGDFLGVVGILALLLFTFFALVVWNKNPSFENLTVEKVKGYMLETFDWKGWLSQSRFLHRSQASGHVDDEDEELDDEEEDEEETEKVVRKSPTPLRPALNAPAKEPVKSNLDELSKKAKEITRNQLAFDLDESTHVPSLSAVNDELEIVPPVPSDAIPDDLEAEMPRRVPPAVVRDGDDEDTAIDYESLEAYDPTLDLSSYENPVLSLLENYDEQHVVIDRAELEQNKDQIVNTLLHYKIEIVKIKATIGPTVTLYEIVPAPGVRISKIKNLEDDIALSLSALGIRIIAPIPGKGTIGIEVPNRNKQIVALRELLASEKFKRAKMELPIAMGKTISNEVYVSDLAKMPHLLVAGATGQGKSVGINCILMSMLYKKHPSQLKLVLIDPKKVELSPYSKIENHFLAILPGEDEAIITDTSKVVQTLHSLTLEMDERYNLLKKANVRHITEYNDKFVARRLNPEKGHRYLPYLVLVVDEFADLIMTAGKEVELPLGRLAQLARAVGVHLIIATQRPSVNIITGVIKANFPARLAFKVTSKIDSRTILDAGGSEQLTGRGDMLLSTGGEIVRLQCAFVDTPEVERVIEFISSQRAYPEPYQLPSYNEGGEEGGIPGSKILEDLDEFFEDSARLVVIHQSGSTSMIQRRLKFGYNRAGRIMDQLEAAGIVGAADGSKPREVLFTDEVELERYLKQLRDKYGK